MHCGASLCHPCLCHCNTHQRYLLNLSSQCCIARSNCLFWMIKKQIERQFVFAKPLFLKIDKGFWYFIISSIIKWFSLISHDLIEYFDTFINPPYMMRDPWFFLGIKLEKKLLTVDVFVWVLIDFVNIIHIETGTWRINGSVRWTLTIHLFFSFIYSVGFYYESNKKDFQINYKKYIFVKESVHSLISIQESSMDWSNCLWKL